MLVTQATARRERLRTIATRLWQRGVHIDVEAILARSHGRSVGRPDLAQAGGRDASRLDEALREAGRLALEALQRIETA